MAYYLKHFLLPKHGIGQPIKKSKNMNTFKLCMSTKLRIKLIWLKFQPGFCHMPPASCDHLIVTCDVNRSFHAINSTLDHILAPLEFVHNVVLRCYWTLAKICKMFIQISPLRFWNIFIMVTIYL
jgi:hypothetical protein